MRNAKRLPSPRALKARATSSTSAADARFDALVRGFSSQPGVTRGGKGFGATGLKVNGKLFAFVSTKGELVVKLPRAQAVAMVDAGTARYFDPGHGRLMKEWVELDPQHSRLATIAKEAYRYVGRGD